MKPTIWICLGALSACFAFAGCGSSDGGSSSPEGAGGMTGGTGGAVGGTGGGTGGATGGTGGATGGTGGATGGTGGATGGTGGATGGTGGATGGTGGATGGTGGATGGTGGATGGTGGATGGTGGATGGTGGATGGTGGATGGTGGACAAGDACDTGNPCETGSLDCTTVPPQCVLAGYEPAGTTCPSGVCDGSGTCLPCEQGAACTPVSPDDCKQGAVDCSNGYAMCIAGADDQSNGTECGGSADYVCKQGVCTYCQEGAPCPGSIDPCRPGVQQCHTLDATPQCEPGPIVAGTSCGSGMFCDGTGACVSCSEGAACSTTGASICWIGSLTCSGPNGPECTPTSTALPNGTGCGANQVCTGGSCVSCTSGASCSPSPDPCASGVTSCDSGAPATCVAGSAVAAQDGKPCGASSAGTCTNGRCVCGAGQAFFQGDCQDCPAFTANQVYVDASATVGQDNLCCGRSTVPGFGGPCRTVTQAIKVVGGSNWAVLVTPDAIGNASPTETYPIHLSRAVNVSGYGTVYFPGAAGKAVFVADVDTAQAWLSGVNIGTNSAGVPSGATDGVVITRNTTGQPGALSLLYVNIKRVATGLRIDGGTLTNNSNVDIQDVTTGVSCVSTTATPSMLCGAQLAVKRASQYDFFAGNGCQTQSICGTSGISLGETPPCTTKRDEVGLHAEGNANLWVTGTISCMNANGIELKSTTGPTNSPSVNFQGSAVQHIGCAGAYVEVGSLIVRHTLFQHDHWGIIQRSSQVGTLPTSALVFPEGRYLGSDARNEFACIGNAEPGSCCTLGSCPPGYGIWNNSGLPINADNNTWQASPVSKCTCDFQLQNCSCSGSAFGHTTPPDGVMVVNSPLVSGGGSPTTSTLTPAVSTLTCD